MDTVKVDIQKLQLLNDRIAQTIEALNQVRLSVHGIQHSAAAFAPWGYGLPGQLPFAAQSPFAAQQAFGTPYVPYATPYPMQFAAPFVPGIQHTTTPYGTPYGAQYVQTPYGAQHVQTPYGVPFTTPFAQPLVAGIQHTTATTQPITTSPTWTMPYVSNGLSHTTWDPTWQNRVAMPFTGTGISHTSWDPTWQNRLGLWQVPFTSGW